MTNVLIKQKIINDVGVTSSERNSEGKEGERDEEKGEI